MIKEKFPPDTVVHENEKGWMDNYVMDCPDIWQLKSLLVLDSMRAHISDDTFKWWKPPVSGVYTTVFKMIDGFHTLLQLNH